MKKIVLTLLLVIMITGVVGAEDYDFRQVNWGMSMEEVKQAEDNSQLREESSTDLIYNITLNNIDFVLKYNFKNNKLYESFYIMNDSFDIGQIYIDKYKYFREILTEKYGDASGKGRMKLGDTYDDTKLALYHKELVYMNNWETDKVKIESYLSKLGDGITILITYKSKEYMNLKEEKEQENKEEDKSNL